MNFPDKTAMQKIVTHIAVYTEKFLKIIILTIKQSHIISNVRTYHTTLKF